eukprot:459932_1
MHLIMSTNNTNITEDTSTMFSSSEIANSIQSDYIDCKNGTHQINECDVMKRIVHLLQYYHQCQTNKSTTSISEYMSLMKHYNISTLMEDWYQLANNHLTTKDAKEWIKDNTNIICNTPCTYSNRYQRPRSNYSYDTNAATDIHNSIIMDQLDSIHIFIHHSMTRQHGYRRFTGNSENEEEFDGDKEKKYDTELWSTVPETIQECNVEQIMRIVGDCISFKIKKTVSIKLIPHRDTIIECIREKRLDGNYFYSMTRKTFAAEMKLFLKLNDNKLKLPLIKLYDSVMTYELNETKTNKINNNNNDINDDSIISTPSPPSIKSMKSPKK